jgi:hypothetical protein
MLYVRYSLAGNDAVHGLLLPEGGNTVHGRFVPIDGNAVMAICTH